MSANKETLGKTVGVVLAVCLACSIVVSGAAVGLRSLQQANAALDKQSNIVDAAGLTETAAGDIAGTFEKYIEERFVDPNNFISTKVDSFYKRETCGVETASVLGDCINCLSFLAVSVPVSAL